MFPLLKSNNNMKNDNIIILPLIAKMAESNYLSTNKDEKEIKNNNNNNPLKIKINIIIIIINNGIGPNPQHILFFCFE